MLDASPCATRGMMIMSKNYGDLPCVNLNNVIHITKNGTECLCGREWAYGRPSRSDKKSVNIIWRKPEAVTCAKCREQCMPSLISNKDIIIVSPSDTAKGLGYTGNVSFDDIVR